MSTPGAYNTSTPTVSEDINVSTNAAKVENLLKEQEENTATKIEKTEALQQAGTELTNAKESLNSAKATLHYASARVERC